MLKSSINKISPYLKNSLGIFLFIVCSIAIYKKVIMNDDWKSVQSVFQSQLISISVFQWAILLSFMFVNLYIEAIKWKKVVEKNNPLRIDKSLQSVFVGQAFAFFTPNRVGEYAGRTLFLSSGNKMIGLAQMAWTSYAQLLVTLVLGTLALFINLSAYTTYNENWLFWIKLLSPAIGIMAIVVFFYKRQWTGWLTFLNILQIENLVKLQLLGLSFFRYCIFISQYIFLAYLLHIPISILTLTLSLSILFLCLSILPTFSITEWAVRGQLLIMILTPFYSNNLMIISFSSIIWGINFLIPSMIGTILLLGYRLQK